MSKLNQEKNKYYTFNSFNNTYDLISILKNYKIDALMDKTSQEQKDSVNQLQEKFNTTVQNLYKKKLEDQLDILTK